MHWLIAFGVWLRYIPVLVLLLIGLLSVVILFGCAIASWVAPSEKQDCLFHREVV